ncbi:J domain-containing protein [Streptomyces sp. NPDC048349]|uniref:J domain-containing protein n=1 Tax=Streptomyces sp. NPDC048349 TaxID=3155486 RepID=UPI00343DDED5
MGDPPPPRDHYAVLGLQAEASPQQVTSAYRTRIRALHPDARPSGPPADAELAAVLAAYRILHDPARRAAYDAEHHQKQQAASRPVRIPVRVRSAADTEARPYPRPTARYRTFAYPATTQPCENPIDRLMAWLLYGI